jgi:aminoglycoside N3'-acetyltransferase
MTATRASLADDLARLSLKPGDLVMVHASLRAIGLVEGGADSVIGTILDTIGPEGTMVMVLGVEIDGYEAICRLPQDEQKAAVAALPPLDLSTAPALKEVGALAEVFRTWPGVQVVPHPDGRFAAIGADAGRLLKDPPWHDYHGPNSVLDRLCDRQGKILRLGADPETVTMLHLAEYYAGVADKRRVRRWYNLARPDGQSLVHVDTLDDENGIVDWPGSDYFGDILNEFLASGKAQFGRVGRARSELFSANDIVCFGSKWMTAHLNPKKRAS